MAETEEYKLPNGCTLRPGCKVRIPSDQLTQIPEEDWERFNLELVEGEQSPYSEVVAMRKI